MIAETAPARSAPISRPPMLRVQGYLLYLSLGLIQFSRGLALVEHFPQVYRNVPTGYGLDSTTPSTSEQLSTGRSFVTASTTTSSSLHGSAMIWVAQSNALKMDRVVRVLDDGSVKLKDSGVVYLEGVKMPKNQGFPSCLSVTPASKLSQLLPAKTLVLVDKQSTSTTSTSAVLTRDSDRIVINDRIIELGYAKASSRAKPSLKVLEATARESQRGIFQSCDNAFQAQFDPLQVPVEPLKPRNPGDRVGCSDFTIYEDALKYYETYFDLYGDVARLDRNSDGIPCPGLPHTVNAELYRIKKPTR